MTISADGRELTDVLETYPSINGVTTVAVTGVAAVLLVPARTGRKSVTLVLEAAVAVRIGGATVTGVANGVLLPAVAGTTLTIETGAAVYGVAPTGTGQVSALEVF